MTETPNTVQPGKPWHARAICCGRDDGTYDFTTKGEAEVFRSHYTAAEGHERAAIITGPASQEKRDAGTVLAEYLEAMRADHGMRAMVEECIALTVEVRATMTAETLRADRAENARDQAAGMLHAAQAERDALRKRVTAAMDEIEKRAKAEEATGVASAYCAFWDAVETVKDALDPQVRVPHSLQEIDGDDGPGVATESEAQR